MSPRDTFFIEPTFRVSKEDVKFVLYILLVRSPTVADSIFDWYGSTIIPLQLWDCPGGMPVENLDVLLDAFSTLVFVIDIQDEYSHAISKLVHLMAMVYTVHPLINIEVFVHKAESMSEDYKIGMSCSVPFHLSRVTYRGC
jgi:Gtr1/RagA G protein conserved region